MEENTDALEPQDTPTEVEEDIKDSFLKGDDKDMQRLSSALGRSLKQQGDLLKGFKTLADKLDSLEAKPQREEPQYQNPDVAALNEKWQNAIFSGNVIDVLDEFTTLRDQAQKNISQANMNKVDKLLTGLQDEPFFNDLAPSVREKAIKFVQGGKDPETAVDLAYNRQRADYLAGLVATVHQHDPKALEVARGGGKRQKETKAAELPANFKKAMERDIKAKVYKDEAEWIANLSPSIRKELGV